MCSSDLAVETYCHDMETQEEGNAFPNHSPLPLVTPVPSNGQPISAHSSPSPLAQSSTVEGTDRLTAVREIWRQSCDQLEQWQQEELWEVLSDFTDIFALSDDEVGLTHLVQHEIDTGDAQPIRTRPRRLPIAHREAADRAVEEMQRDGIIEPSDSPWASGVVMVSKKKKIGRAHV